MIIRGIVVISLCVFFSFFGCGSGNGKPEISRQDSACIAARKYAEQQAKKGFYSVSIPGLSDALCPFAEEMFQVYYKKNVSVPRKAIGFCGMDAFDSDRLGNDCYSRYMDSLVQTFGKNVYQRVAAGADSLYRIDPYRHCDCFMEVDFPGGQEALSHALASTIKYPASAKRDSVQGIVYVKMKIDSTGKVYDATVIKSVRHDLDSAAVNGILRLPDFIPVQVGNRKVGSCRVQPVKFILK